MCKWDDVLAMAIWIPIGVGLGLLSLMWLYLGICLMEWVGRKIGEWGNSWRGE